MITASLLMRNTQHEKETIREIKSVAMQLFCTNIFHNTS